MKMVKDSKEKKKLKSLTVKEIKEEARRMDEAKAKYSRDLAKVESALTEYLETLDPMLWINPKGETVAIAWIRRPSMKKLKEMIPKEMREYVDNPLEVPEELNKKYESHFYEKMAEMIAIPERTPEEWETKANPWFIRRFWEHIASIAQMMEGQIEGF